MNQAIRINAMYGLILSIIILLINCSGQNEGQASMKLLEKADEHFNNQDLDKAKEFYLEAAAIAEKENNNSILVEAWSQAARCYLKQNNMDEGKKWLEKAARKASSDEPKGWTRYLGVRGRFEWQEAVKEKKETAPVTEKAAATFKEMYDYCLKHELFRQAVDAANMVSITGAMDERTGWSYKGIEAAEKGNLDDMLAILWNNLGWNFSDNGENDKALEALLKAREYHYKGDKELPKLIADWSVGHAYRMTGQIDSAVSWMTKVNDWAARLYREDSSEANTEWVGFANNELGEIAIVKGDKKLALKHFSAAKEKLAKVGMPNWDAKGFKKIINYIESLQAELKE